MLLITFILSLMFSTTLAQSGCGPTPTDVFSQVVMRYTPYMTPQIAPVSTIYQTILTTWYNAVDCRYVTPLRVDENPAQEGPFTTFVNSPTLTITRVGCLPETTAVTRRELQVGNQLEMRTAPVSSAHQIQRRHTAEEAIDRVIEKMSLDILPDDGTMTVQAYRYIVSLNSAIFAVNLVDAGFPLDTACSQLRDPASQAKLFQSDIDPVQAGNIVCFASTNGLYFPVPSAEIISNLQILIYAIQIFETDEWEDVDDLCPYLNIADASLLGIDADGIQSFLCSNYSTTATASGSTIPIEPTVSIGTGLPNSGPFQTGGPYANSTEPNTTSGEGPYGSSIPYANSTAISATGGYPTGTGASFGTEGTGIIFPNATYPGSGTASAYNTGNVPPAPTSVQPSIESVVTAPNHRFHRW